jgi:ankyrin repeat protein
MMRENIEYVVCRGENDYPAILTASMLNVNTIKCLLSHGASPISPAVARPAHYALMVGEELFSHLKSVGGLAFETLHAYGQEDLPFPVLDFTVVLGTSEALATAHKYGCKPTQRNSLDTKSLLEHAVENGKVDSLETLLTLYKNDINVNEITYRGHTALHTAADSGKLGCVVQLLHNGADHTIKNKQGLTALDLAIINNHVDTIKVLENHAKGIKTLPLTKEESEAYANLVLESELVVGNTLIDKYEENPLYKWVDVKGTILLDD